MFNDWRYGVCQLSKKDIKNLDFSNGILLEVTPSRTGRDSILGMQRILYLLQNYPGHFSFEIWRDKGFRFFFFSSALSVEGMLRSQLYSVYPQVEVRRARTSFPNITEGSYISSCSISLTGSDLNLSCPEEFHYDPLRHVMEAMNVGEEKMVAQILFERMNKIPKNKIAVIAQKYGDDFFPGIRIPIFKCLIRIFSACNNRYKARENMEHVARTFSVFDSKRARLIPRLLHFPIPRNSSRTLAGMVRRKFPLLQGGFLISIPELTSMVHLPVGIPGVEYTGASLSEPNFTR